MSFLLGAKASGNLVAAFGSKLNEYKKLEPISLGVSCVKDDDLHRPRENRALKAWRPRPHMLVVDRVSVGPPGIQTLLIPAFLLWVFALEHV